MYMYMYVLQIDISSTIPLEPDVLHRLVVRETDLLKNVEEELLQYRDVVMRKLEVHVHTCVTVSDKGAFSLKFSKLSYCYVGLPKGLSNV